MLHHHKEAVFQISNFWGKYEGKRYKTLRTISVSGYDCRGGSIKIVYILITIEQISKKTLRKKRNYQRDIQNILDFCKKKKKKKKKKTKKKQKTWKITINPRFRIQSQS